MLKFSFLTTTTKGNYSLPFSKIPRYPNCSILKLWYRQDPLTPPPSGSEASTQEGRLQEIPT